MLSGFNLSLAKSDLMRNFWDENELETTLRAESFSLIAASLLALESAASVFHSSAWISILAYHAKLNIFLKLKGKKLTI
jgi:hypothetical protein